MNQKLTPKSSGCLTSNFHESEGFVIYCAAYGTESLFSLVRFVNFQNVEKLGIKNLAVYEAVYLKVCYV